MVGRVSTRRGGAGRRALATAGSVVALAAVAASLVGVPRPAAAAPATGDALYLVTLDGPGTSGYRGIMPAPLHRLQLQREQDALLAQVGSPAPVYRWTTALNGLAVRLTAGQAHTLAADPHVALVEKNAVRRLAGRPAPSGGFAGSGHRRGGAGTVVGVVDSGIWPDNPLFAAVPDLGPGPPRLPRHLPGGRGLGREQLQRQAGRGPLVRRRLRRRPGPHLLLALPA